MMNDYAICVGYIQYSCVLIVRISFLRLCYRHAFVGLEMVGGRIRGSLHTGAGVVALQSTESVNDGRWHRVRWVNAA